MADTKAQLTYPTGATLYTQWENESGNVHNGTAYVAKVLANWATYATATAETPAGFGVYESTFPASSPAGNYRWRHYLRVGASAAASDPPVGGGSGYWDGTTFGNVPAVTGSVGSVTAGVVANSIRTGTAQGGTLTTITLDAGASAVSNTYQNCGVVLTGGTGSGQSGVITFGGYNGATKVCTMTTPWATAPDNTTTFAVVAQGAVVLGQIGGTARTVTQDYLGTDELTVTSATTGLPISGATVRAYLASAFSSQGTSAPVIASTTTDASGHWSLSLSPSSYVVLFSFNNESTQVTFTVS